MPVRSRAHSSRSNMGAWQHLFWNPCRTGRDSQRKKDGASQSLGWGPSIARAQELFIWSFLDRPVHPVVSILHCLLPGCAQGPTQHVECSALHPVSTKCRLCVIALCFLPSYLRCLVHFFLRSLLRAFFFPFPRASLSGVASEHLTFYIPEQFGLAKRWPCRPPTSSAPGSSQDLSSTLGISLRGWTQLRLLHS